MNLETSISASLEAVSKFTARLESDLQWLSLETRTAVVLAVQELLVNIVEHAYVDTSGTIDFRLDQSDTLMTISVTEYSGTAFIMPDTINDPDPFALQESGLGLFIITQTFDDVNYISLSGSNQWNLTKKVEP